MNERIDDLIALAALGELTGDESRELNEAMRADPRVAEEVAAAMTAAATVQSAAAEDPPPALKMSVMDAIAGVAQDPPAEPVAPVTPAQPIEPAQPVAPVEPMAPATPAFTSTDDTPDTDTPNSDTPGSDTTVRPIGSARSRRGIAPWLIAAAAAIVMVVGAVMVLSNDSTDGLDSEIAAVLRADDAVERSMTGEIGDLEVVYSAEQDAFVVTGEGIEPVAGDATYQVWLVDDAGPASMGVVVPDDTGALQLRADGVDPTGAVVAITVEPAGGSEQPTMPIVAQTA